MNESIAILIKNIKAKLAALQQAHKAAIQKNEVLQKKIATLEEKNQQMALELSDMQAKLTALKTLKGNLSVDERKALSKTIDQHIKQLDQTINLLSE